MVTHYCQTLTYILQWSALILTVMHFAYTLYCHNFETVYCVSFKAKSTPCFCNDYSCVDAATLTIVFRNMLETHFAYDDSESCSCCACIFCLWTFRFLFLLSCIDTVAAWYARLCSCLFAACLVYHCCTISLILLVRNDLEVCAEGQ